MTGITYPDVSYATRTESVAAPLPVGEFQPMIKMLAVGLITVFLASLALTMPAASADCTGEPLRIAEIELPEIMLLETSTSEIPQPA